ncbi:MAG: ornithine decarboxylase, partial [Salibacteraceae bacterium]
MPETKSIQTKTSTGKGKLSYREYYNISEYRTKLWYELKELSDQCDGNGTTDEEMSVLVKRSENCLKELSQLECYWAFPGISRLDRLKEALQRREFKAFSNGVEELVRLLVSRAYYHDIPESFSFNESEDEYVADPKKGSHYFEVLVVNDIEQDDQDELRNQLRQLRNINDDFVYDIVVVRTFQDALMALNFNHNIQSCVIRYSFPFRSENSLKNLRQFVTTWLSDSTEAKKSSTIGIYLGDKIKELRPELDLFLVTDLSIDKLPDAALENFKNIFYRQEDLTDLHLNILKGIFERFETPFYNALVEYSKRPTGVFHAMPISRGNSIFKSNWIREMGDFYGKNIFLAETSATTGGLDSLLQPVGPLKKAQELASRAFGSKRTFFVTNGTSTANKIVVQALLHPDDIVLIDRDCHKSHHYGMVL